MLQGLASPFICAANPHIFSEWFACLNRIIHHPILLEEEKFFWLWLATKSANNKSFTCSFTYEQLSQAMNKPLKTVHRILLRLRCMGFLIADIPVYYGVPTKDMSEAVREIQMITPPKGYFIPGDEGRRNILPPLKGGTPSCPTKPLGEVGKAWGAVI